MVVQEQIGSAVNSMISALTSAGPEILQTVTSRNERRLQAPGGPISPNAQTGSPHHQGRALDIVLFNGTDERLIADNLIQRFLAGQSAIGWEYMAYNRQCWSDKGTPAPLIWTKEKGETSGMREAYVYEHHTHIHIQWSKDKKNIDYSAQILAALKDLRVAPAELAWPMGWWRVWDGGTWCYFLGPNGVAMSSKTLPANTRTPPAKAHNTGTWTYSSPTTLVITWKQVAGARMPCKETFWNAGEGCAQMNANSNLYSPLVARRIA